MSMRSFFVLFISLFLNSCAAHEIGMQLKPGKYPGFQGNTGHHEFLLKDLYMEYVWDIDSDSNKINLEGYLQFQKDKVKWSLSNLSKLIIKLYFLDADYKVIDVQQMTFWPHPQATMTEPLEFKRSVKYSPDSRYVTHSYRANMRD
jgi:hypothetical protein